jgi:hypothetical protein
VTRPLRIGEAIDLFLGDLARQGRKDATLVDYRYKLNLLADDVRDAYVDQIDLTDYERFLKGRSSVRASRVQKIRTS